MGFPGFSGHGVSYIGNIFNINGKSKSWDTIKYEYNFTNTKNRLETANLNWKKVYTLPTKVSVDANFRMFQHKILDNILIPQ